MSRGTMSWWRSPLLLRPLGICVPIYPVKGISPTVPAAPGPDDSGLFGMVPIGDRLRVSGSAEIACYDTYAQPAARPCRGGERAAQLPGIRRVLRPHYREMVGGVASGHAKWRYMGRTGLRNLFVNAGHGHLGWTMSCGAGRTVAAMVAGDALEIDLSDFPIVPGALPHCGSAATSGTAEGVGQAGR
jgi:D-amino-acid dehydrogenase